MQSLHGISSSSEVEELRGNRSGSPGVKGLFDEVISGAAFLSCKQYKQPNAAQQTRKLEKTQQCSLDGCTEDQCFQK